MYNLFFHPLRHIPGPLAWRATNLPWSWTLISGRLPFTVLSLHQQYGPVVRIRPDEVSFSDPRAWQDIYGHKVVGKMAGLTSGLKELPKYDRFYKRFPKQPGSFLTADWHDHATQRRLIAPSFSDKSMREQEPILTEYIDLLMRRLYENADDGPVNLREWYNWATFDIMGDLAFGDSFGCLRSNTYHPFVSLIAGNPRINAVLISLRYMGLTKLTLLIFAVFVKTRKTVRSYGIQTMERRLAVGNPRPDLIEPFIEKKTKGELSYEQLVITAAVFIIAGSETTASLLTGVTFLLLTHPEALAKATAEVRAAFKSEKDITLNGVQNLKYMIACLTEALRYYPPAPAGFPREVPEGGAIIADTPLPPEVSTSLWSHYPSFGKADGLSDSRVCISLGVAPHGQQLGAAVRVPARALARGRDLCRRQQGRIQAFFLWATGLRWQEVSLCLSPEMLSSFHLRMEPNGD